MMSNKFCAEKSTVMVSHKTEVHFQWNYC